MHIIDLRSDTITKPTPAMRRAMAEAEVGDDVLGDDPTVMRLEEMSAARLGKEAGLFVASGTMGNLVSLLAHCGRGDEVILGDLAHIFINEQGGMAALGGIHPHTIRNQPDGTLDLADVAAAIRRDDVHYPRTRLITVENTHNLCNGAALTPEYMAALGGLARDRGLRVHVDGARIFNAAVALGIDVRLLARDADSVTFCLSKGLAAPVGSVIVGSRAFIAEARRTRKVVGGGMRQVGVLAAAGIVALEQMVDRLAEDHANARALVDGLAGVAGIAVEPSAHRTNIVYLRVTHPQMDARQLQERLGARGVQMLALNSRLIRAVTHYHLDRRDIDAAVQVIREVLAA
ncbi:MAG: L-allo-threonine aldolase [Chloroflexi bacterium ADurb.Bin325]|nr:MAG: L-allo-threonine aldolase [Chloroflexi bacterium ADurb.Bin325]